MGKSEKVNLSGAFALTSRSLQRRCLFTYLEASRTSRAFHLICEIAEELHYLEKEGSQKRGIKKKKTSRWG